MKSFILPQASWFIGTVLIVVFAVVCLILIGVVLSLVMTKDKKKINGNR